MAVANKELMRAINRFAILHAIRDAGSISRVEIARRTGLSQATVTAISAELIGERLLLEQQGGISAGGRRPVPLTLNPTGAYTVGVHLSVDQVCVVLMDLQATIIGTYTSTLGDEGYDLDAVVARLLESVQTCLWQTDFNKKQISGVGVAVPGLIDSRTGFVHYVPNYQWRGIELAHLLRDQLGMPAYVENSANVLAIFEQWFGVGRGADNFLLITTEHGIGMGLVLDGKLYRGSRGFAGEFGHLQVDAQGPLCRCGQVGCLEAICGNNAIIRDAEEAARLGLWPCEQPGNLTIEAVLAAAERGEPALRAIYRRVGRTLGVGINNMQALFDPERIIVSGKGVLAGDMLFGPLQEVVHPDISLTDDAACRLFIQPWQPTNYARAAGALVLQEIYKSPANRVVPLI
ncbi:MAG: ROK family transcriptional regulator [Desulfofustis sp.]|nr:ROK family transcriptional regulator [Desulfofustis sp.]